MIPLLRKWTAVIAATALLTSLFVPGIAPRGRAQASPAGDLVQGKTIVADSANFASSLPKEKMIDGKRTYADRAAWSSRVKSAYIVIDLGSSQSFNTAVIYPTIQVVSVTVKASDSWTNGMDSTAWPVVTTLSFAGLPQSQSFPSRTARYVRVDIKTVGGGGVPEFELYNGLTAPVSIALDQASAPFVSGGIVQLTAAVNGEDAYDGIVWTTDNPTVATVGNNGASNMPSGLVRMGASPGSATIRATSLANPAIYAEFKVLNTQKDMISFSFDSLNPPAVGAISGSIISVTVPDGTDVSHLAATYTTVSEAVYVGGVKQTSGVSVNDFRSSVTYSVYAEDGSSKDYSVVLTFVNTGKPDTMTAFGFYGIDPPVLAEISGTDVKVALPPGVSPLGLVATYATGSSNVYVGDVRQQNGVTANDFVYPVTYRIYGNDNTFQDYKVSVMNQTIPVSSVDVNPSSLALEYGATATLGASVSPENATFKGITWTSSNPDIVSVTDRQISWDADYNRIVTDSDQGFLRALRPGTAEITAQAVYGGPIAKITVTVGAAPSATRSGPYYLPNADQAQIANILSAADKLLADYDDEAWQQLVPTGPPRRYVNSPVPGSAVSLSTSLADVFSEMWDWDPHHPNQIADSKTGVTFIHNPDDTFTVTNPKGTPGIDLNQLQPHYVTVKNAKENPVSVPVWNMPLYASSSKSTTTLVQTRIDYEKEMFMETQFDPGVADGALVTLAKAAYFTTDPVKKAAYTQRVAEAFRLYAERVPNFYVTNSNNVNGGNPQDADVTPIDYYKGPTVAGLAGLNRFSRFSDHNGNVGEIKPAFVTAFDLIYGDPALDTTSPAGSTLRDYIGENLFADSFYFIRDYYPIDVFIMSNLKGLQVQIARLGTIMDRPDFIEWVDGYLKKNLDLYFKRDYMDGESIQYSSMAASTTYQLAAEIPKFFDIYPDYTSRLPHIVESASLDVDKARKTTLNWRNVAYPNGYVPPDGDSDYIKAPPRTSTSSYLLPAYGHAMLGDGAGTQQTQINRNFTDSGNHVHQDKNSFTLFAFGQELMGDIRYVHLGRPERDFSTGITAHSTVLQTMFDPTRGAYVTMNPSNNGWPGLTFDGHADEGGNLTLFEPGINGIEAAEVDGALKQQGPSAERSQRLQILNTRDESRPYVIDLFKLQGGSRHDYLLHGATDYDMTATAGAGLALSPLTNEQFQAANGSFYSPQGGALDPYSSTYFKNMSEGKSPGNWDVTYTRSDNPQSGVKIFMTDDGSNQVFLGQSMVPVREGSLDSEQFWRPTLMVRHEEPNTTQLDSLFISVIEPFDGEAAISGIQQLPVNDSDPDHVALSIQFKDGREDVVLVNLNNPAITHQADPANGFETADGKYSLDGRIGIQTIDGAKEASYLIGGHSFAYQEGSKSIANHSVTYSGGLTGTLRVEDGATANAFVTNADLPGGDTLKGRWLSLTFGTYHVIPAANGTYPTTYDGQPIKEQNGLSQMFQIDHVEKKMGSTYIYLADDPALRMANGMTVEVDKPRRSFDGYGTFEIQSSDYAEKLDTVPPAIQIAAPADGNAYTDDQTLQLDISVIDDWTGVDEGKTIVLLDNRPVAADSAIALYKLPLGNHTLSVQAQDRAGNASQASITFQTKTSLQSLAALLDIFTDTGWIADSNWSNSLRIKLEHGDVIPFLHEVQAQRGKKIDENAAGYLVRDAEALGTGAS